MDAGLQFSDPYRKITCYRKASSSERASRTHQDRTGAGDRRGGWAEGNPGWVWQGTPPPPPPTAQAKHPAHLPLSEAPYRAAVRKAGTHTSVSSGCEPPCPAQLGGAAVGSLWHNPVLSPVDTQPLGFCRAVRGVCGHRAQTSLRASCLKIKGGNNFGMKWGFWSPCLLATTRKDTPPPCSGSNRN